MTLVTASRRPLRHPGFPARVRMEALGYQRAYAFDLPRLLHRQPAALEGEEGELRVPRLRTDLRLPRAGRRPSTSCSMGSSGSPPCTTRSWRRMCRRRAAPIAFSTSFTSIVHGGGLRRGVRVRLDTKGEKTARERPDSVREAHVSARSRRARVAGRLPNWCRVTKRTGRPRRRRHCEAGTQRRRDRPPPCRERPGSSAST